MSTKEVIKKILLPNSLSEIYRSENGQTTFSVFKICVTDRGEGFSTTSIKIYLMNADEGIAGDGYAKIVNTNDSLYDFKTITEAGTWEIRPGLCLGTDQAIAIECDTTLANIVLSGMVTNIN